MILEKELDKIFNKWQEAGINPDAYKLYTVLKNATKLDQYKQGYLYKIGENKNQKETYCNIYARDILDSKYIAHQNSWANGIGGLISEYNYNIDAINPGANITNIILNTTIPNAHKNLRAAIKSEKVESLSEEEAQAKANLGKLVHVISVWCNHEALVCPDPTGYKKERGCLLGQAGAYNGIIYLLDKKTFGAYNDRSDLLFVRYSEAV